MITGVKTVATAGVLLAGLTACGGGSHRATTVPQATGSASGSTSAPPSPAGATTTPKGAASTAPSTVKAVLTTARLKTALLTVAEMPTGFSLSKPTPDTSSDDASGSACAKRYAALSKSNARDNTTAKADRAFDQGGLTGEYVDQQLSAFPAELQARASLKRFTSVVSDCPTFTTVDKAGTRTDLTFQALSFPKLGDETFAAKVTAKSAGTNVSGHLVATRDGPLIQLVKVSAWPGRRSALPSR